MKKIKLIIYAMAILCVLHVIPAAANEDAGEVGLKFKQGFTIKELADANSIPVSLIMSKLGLNQADSALSIDEVTKRYPHLNTETIKEETTKVLIENKIESQKNWKLIVLKFLLWVLLVVSLAVLLKRGSKIVFKPLLLLLSAMVFGVLLGSDPNPLGTVKDGIILYADSGVLFKPRFVALTFLLLLVLIFGRLFCGWGCQIGVIQDLLYRIRVKKIKAPFWVTNTVRILVFAAMIAFAFVFHVDILGYVDPFKIYFSFAAVNLGFLIILTALSVFIYRPWCSLACPFGLIAWGVDKFSFLKLRINNDSCTNCGACERKCPTGAATGLREGQKLSECYLCDRCREACPSGSFTYGR